MTMQFRKNSILTPLIYLVSFFVFVISPLAANASTNITVSNNGSGSQNTVTVNNSDIFTVIQTNFSNIFNFITTNSNTGGNTCTGNTKSKCKIKTGNVTTNTDVTVTGNANIVSVPEFSVLQGIMAGMFCLGGFFVLRKKALI